MTIAAEPDVMGAISLRLRSFSEILAFVTTPSGYTDNASASDRAVPRIASEIQPTWNLPRYALVVEGPIGNPSGDREADLETIRCDLKLYGPNRYEALRFYRSVNPCLCPTAASRRAEAFVSGGVRFHTVDREGGPARLVEPTNRYIYVLATYVFRYSLIGVAP